MTKNIATALRRREISGKTKIPSSHIKRTEGYKYQKSRYEQVMNHSTVHRYNELLDYKKYFQDTLSGVRNPELNAGNSSRLRTLLQDSIAGTDQEIAELYPEYSRIVEQAEQYNVSWV